MNDPPDSMNCSISIWVKSEEKSHLDFDLIDVLRCLELEARPLDWQALRVEALGDRASELHTLADAGVTIPGSKLIQIAGGISQVIDGDFIGRHATSGTPVLIIRAIDSSEYCVETDDSLVVEKLRQTFRKVTER